MERKRIAIMTLKDSPNYGGILQAYALETKIKQLGFDCDLIDYITPEFKKKFTFFGKPPRMSLIYWIYKKAQYPLMRKMMRKMMPFYTRHMTLTRKFTNSDELNELNLTYDGFVTGSDQVFACDLNSYNDCYYLSFANPDKIRFSYAASFGRTLNMLCDDEKEFIKRGLPCLDIISLREKSGVEIVKELSGKTSCDVLDPTLLLNKIEWQAIAQKPKKTKKNYVLCYLMQSRKNDRCALKYAKRIAKQKGLALVKICRGLTSVLWGETLYIPSVEEFLGLYANASYVVTNSFHGVAFAINFEKQFTAFAEGDLASGRNSRLFNICSYLGLLDRIIEVSTNCDVASKMDIDFTVVSKKLELLKLSSLEFLEGSLNSK